MKKLIISLVFCVLSGAVSIVAAAGETKQRIEIVAVNDEGSDPVVFRFSTDEDLSDLRDGESRVVTDDDGVSVTVTRNGENLTLVSASGHEVEVPFLQGQEIHLEHHDDKNVQNRHVEKNVRVIRKHKEGSSDDVMILAPGGLSDYEKQVLRDAFTSAGINKELHFVGEGMNANIDIEIDSSD